MKRLVVFGILLVTAALPADLIPTGAELDALVRLWEREAALGSTMLLVEGAEPAADTPRGRYGSDLVASRSRSSGTRTPPRVSTDGTCSRDARAHRPRRCAFTRAVVV